MSAATRATIRAAVAYFGIVFALGFALGAIRVLGVAPSVGELAAVLLEAPIMLAASWLACEWALKAFGVRDRLDGVVVGLIAFALLMTAEAVLALAAFGQSLDGFLRALATKPGLVGLVSQIVFATFPAFRAGMGRDHSRR